MTQYVPTTLERRPVISRISPDYRPPAKAGPVLGFAIKLVVFTAIALYLIAFDTALIVGWAIPFWRLVLGR